MRQRLTMRAGVLAGGLVLTACAGADGTDRGAIRENVIEPGITAIAEAETLACDGDAATIRTALEQYELLERSPAPDEASLVTEGYLRTESELWDVVDGRLVAADPECGDVATSVPAAEIVTTEQAGAPVSADELMAGYSDDEIASVGGADCARELAIIFAGVDRFIAEQGREPLDLIELGDGGYFIEPVSLWQVVDDSLIPADGGPCIEVTTAEEAVVADACETERRTLETAVEAYTITNDAAPPDEAALVGEYIRADLELADIADDGTVIAAPGSICDTAG